MGHCCRVESGPITPGIPDVNIQMRNGPEVWIELKVVNPKGKLHVRSGQRAWHTRRLKEGGKCFILTKWEYTYFLNRGITDGADPNDWMADSGIIWTGSINFDQLEEILRNA